MPGRLMVGKLLFLLFKNVKIINMEINKKIPWNKGYNKFTHPSVLKISQTLATKPKSNFYLWQIENKRNYNTFNKNEGLAELIGVVLGDGHIQEFPRTERLIISSHSDNKGFINRYAGLIRKIFGKEPTLMKSKNSNCVRIGVYEKFISKRLEIPSGAKNNLEINTPNWILKRKAFIVSYLRGLYEAEGSFCIHKPTCTYKLIFTNTNESLLDSVYFALRRIGFNPHRSQHKIQISRKQEVYNCKELIEFRKY